MSSLFDESLRSMIMAQPVVLWSLIIGGTILVMAFLIVPLLNAARRMQALADRRSGQAAPGTATEAEAAVAAEAAALLDALADDADPPSSTKTKIPKKPGGGVTQTAGGESSDDPAQIVALEEKPEEEVDEDDLSNIFKTETIVDPHLAALRESLPALEAADLLSRAGLILERLSTQAAVRE